MLAAGAGLNGTDGLIVALAAFLGLAGLAGATVAVLRSNLATKTIDLLQKNNTALTDLHTTQGLEIEQLQRDVKACRDRDAEKDGKIKILTDLVSGHSAVKDLTTRLDGYHEALMKAILALTEAVAKKEV